MLLALAWFGIHAFHRVTKAHPSYNHVIGAALFCYFLLNLAGRLWGPFVVQKIAQIRHAKKRRIRKEPWKVIDFAYLTSLFLIAASFSSGFGLNLLSFVCDFILIAAVLLSANQEVQLENRSGCGEFTLIGLVLLFVAFLIG